MPRLLIATATASPRRPELSEDRLAVHHVPGGVVVVVADGAGGLPGGGVAADFALRLVAERIGDPHFDPFGPESWTFPLAEADREIERDRVAGETTCVVVAVSDAGLVVGASCGDSGALVVDSQGTVADLTEWQGRKRLGSGRAVPMTFGRSVLESTVVIATDGLLAYVRPDVIAQVVVEQKNPDQAAAALVRAARLPSGGLMDDLAVVLVVLR